MNRIKIADVHTLLDLVHKVQTETEHRITFRINNYEGNIMAALYGYDENEIVFLKCFCVYPYGNEADITYYRECKQYLKELLEEK